MFSAFFIIFWFIDYWVHNVVLAVGSAFRWQGKYDKELVPNEHEQPCNALLVMDKDVFRMLVPVHIIVFFKQ